MYDLFVNVNTSSHSLTLVGMFSFFTHAFIYLFICLFIYLFTFSLFQVEKNSLQISKNKLKIQQSVVEYIIKIRINILQTKC